LGAAQAGARFLRTDALACVQLLQTTINLFAHLGQALLFQLVVLFQQAQSFTDDLRS
jgi:hypothetical protein